MSTTTTDAGRALDVSTLQAQIGRMTLGAVGARWWVRLDESTVEFTISRGHRVTRIRLNGLDLYDVVTIMKRSGKTVFSRSNVYADQVADAVWDAHIEQR